MLAGEALANEIKVNRFLLGYCHMLTGDVADERMTEQPLPGVNHPAWIIGHLASSAQMIVVRLGGETFLPEGWTEPFKPGSSPSSTRGDYPSKTELLGTLDDAYQRARDAAAGASAEALAAPSFSPRMKETLPTMREAMAFVLTGHVGVHLGQLSAWRRMTGLPPLF